MISYDFPSHFFLIDHMLQASSYLKPHATTDFIVPGAFPSVGSAIEPPEATSIASIRAMAVGKLEEAYDQRDYWYDKAVRAEAELAERRRKEAEARATQQAEDHKSMREDLEAAWTLVDIVSKNISIYSCTFEVFLV